MVLVSTLLDDFNYLSWRTSMITALEAKTKLGFVDGSCIEPASNTVNHRKWRKAHSMVLSWLKNSIYADLRDNFIYVQGAKELWDEITEKFGTANLPLLFQIKRELSLTQQGDLMLAQYTSRLKNLWDQLRPSLRCDSDSKSELERCEAEDRLLQFLMGLNDIYDSVRDQILLMDTLPSINKAYSMISRAESQQKIRTTMVVTLADATFYAAGHINTSQVPARSSQGGAVMPSNGSSTAGDIIALAVTPAISATANFPSKMGGRKSQVRRDRSSLKCYHCNRTGHIKDDCFELHGIPDWYHDFKARRQNSGNSSHVAAETPLEGGGWDDLISTAVRRELARTTKNHVEGDIAATNTAYPLEFAGPQA